MIEKYDFLKLFSIGKSVLHNEINCIKFGIGKKQIMYSAGIHANEFITSIVLLKFIEDLSIAYTNNSKIYDFSICELYNNSSIYIIPMINPDGVNLVNNFYDSNSDIYKKCLNISNKFPSFCFPLDWKANINGESLINFHHFIFKKQCSLYYISIVFASNVILPFQHSKFSLFQ